ncbi:MAG: aspartate kinase [Eubacteriaceae bacterium]
MNIIVQKYGGTSVNTIYSRNKIIENLQCAIKNGYNCVIVVSAMGRKGEPYATDSLLKLIPSDYHNTREMDMLITCGEIISSVVISSHLKKFGFDTIPMTGGQAGIITDDNFGNSNIIKVENTRIAELLKSNKIPVVAGFQGITSHGEITTIGRGGSDVTAVLLGISLNAKHVEIFTDVDGIMTADPKVVPTAKLINQIDYNEVFQLAEYGAKIIHPRAVELAMNNNMPIMVYNTTKYTDKSGTLINDENFNCHRIITAIAHEHNKVQCTLKIKSSNSYILNNIAKNNISIDLINVFKDYSVFIINDKNKYKLKNILNENNISYDLLENCTKITIIGNKIKGVPGIMAKLISSLQGNIDILQTSDSHTTISILVESKYSNETINLLHNTFNLNFE